jgi:predicted transcriptional regulator
VASLGLGPRPIQAKSVIGEALLASEEVGLLLAGDVDASPRPVTLRITLPNDDQATLRLDGSLRAVEVPELERAVEDGVRAVDLEHLLSADEKGLAALRRLRAGGIEIRNPSRYLAMLLA